MDLGCIDMGCIEKQSKETSPDKQTSPSDSFTATSKSGKWNMGVLNKFTSQIKKPSHRKSSPINWFPRKKGASYLERKIKLLQEVDGMNSTLDETLGDSNPHYSRVLREKMAVREAANKAMEARKAALVEASWCRILQASRIESKEAEAQLLKAEECAAKAFEAATAIGVIMHDMPDCPQKHYKIETSSPKGGSTTHTIKASFETAFDVDKQVAAAVKSAFKNLANCPSITKEEFRELLRKISEHPGIDENYQEMLAFSSDCESDAGTELEIGSGKESCQDLKDEEYSGLRQKKRTKRHVFEKFKMTNLVEMMLERLKGLQEDELASLATIVATCGLNAALAEAENINKVDLGSAASYNTSTNDAPRRNSNAYRHMRGKTPDSALPSLDKFLVKRLTKLEREVLEAKNARNSEQARKGNEQKPEYQGPNDDLRNLLQKPSSKSEKEIKQATENSEMIFDYGRKKSESDVISVGDLGSVLMKHTSKLEKEIRDAKKQNDGCVTNGKKLEKKTLGRANNDGIKVPTLDKFLVKHMSRLEKEVQEAKDRRFSCLVEGDALGKENVDQNKIDADDEVATNVKRREDIKKLEMNKGSLDQGLVKHMSRLEREKLTAAQQPDNQIRHSTARREKREREMQEAWGGLSLDMNKGSLDQSLVKHKSRLEKEKMSAAQQPENRLGHSTALRKAREREIQESWAGLSLDMRENNLDQVLVKHKSRLEREKLSAAQQPDDQIRHSTTRREAREKELQEAWGGVGLGNTIRPHLSRLERDKAAWLKAEEEERRKAMEA